MVLEQAGSDLRSRVLALLRVTRESYRNRMPDGYPNIIEDVEGGIYGIQLDPKYALYFREEDGEVSAEIYRWNPRTDNRSSAGWQRYGGQPYVDRRPLGRNFTDQTLRNLISELMSYYNSQPGLLYITDD